MVLNNIENLLEKYENGETSLKEEQVLKNYFSSDTVAPHLEMYKPMFAYFLGNQQEQFTKDVPLKTKRIFNYKWLSVAAVAVLMLGVYFKDPVAASYNEYAYGTYDKPEEALNEVTKSLEMISQSFNKGTSTVGYLNEVNKGTSTLGYLNEIENTTSIIFKTN
ncbi:hypothetical protein [Jejuia spongiicola]|uniref:DUF3379 family protein n=1 Tax=Jejuia spongiicola TaxID=2942207 RepID=A0ABT0QBZ2_9FLAO|nr:MULTISPECIES: hypothetical protein [Flavobacteriaceae]MCL6294456.1 hypothetical protein [Jejuia spongiicola]PIA79352.1 hypothetical protein BFR04_00430 [Gaetbulibacter sp. 4G1]